MTATEFCRNEAYYTISNLPESRARVFRVIVEHGPISSDRIGDILGLTPNRISGRVKELREARLITDAGVEVSKFNKQVVRWEVSAPKPNSDGQFGLGI